MIPDSDPIPDVIPIEPVTFIRVWIWGQGVEITVGEEPVA